jgi:plastocyanin
MKLRVLVTLFLCSSVAGSAAAQSVLERTPNMSAGWVGARNTLYFNFLHRFVSGDTPLRQVTNYPTFLLAYRAPVPVLVGFQYATRSDLVARYPNEWEFFGRWGALTQAASGIADASLQVGYNLAAESVDGEVSLGRRFGRVRAFGAARVLGSAYGNDMRTALAGGLVLHVNRYIALAGDYAQLLDMVDTEDPAWGAALQLAIPYTPHTLSLQATNTNTASLQGSSRGGNDVRYGFEFTIPFTLSRYFGGGATMSPPVLDPAAPAFSARIVNLTFVTPRIEIPAGTTITWTNEDDVLHTVTAIDGSWNSGPIRPRATWSRTFSTPGTYEYFCVPHPEMKGSVIVRAPNDDA